MGRTYHLKASNKLHCSHGFLTPGLCLKTPICDSQPRKMTNPRILLLGGHGKVSLLLTPKLVSRSWDVISVIRKPEQSGKVVMGKTPARGQVTRGDVAEVAARLLEREGARGWFDLLGGDADLGAEVDRVVKEKVDSREGESLDVMKKDLKL